MTTNTKVVEKNLEDMSIAELREKFRALKIKCNRYDDLLEESELKREKLKKELMDGEEKYERFAESMSEVLPLRKAEKRISRKFNNQTENCEKLEKELDEGEKLFEGMRQLLNKLVDERHVWSEEREEYREVAKETQESASPSDQFHSRKERIIAKLNEMMGDGQLYKDLKTDFENFLEAEKEHLSKEWIGQQWEDREESEENINELENEDTSDDDVESSEDSDSDESTSSANSE